MLLCRHCGQSKWISDDNFVAYRSIHGSETVYVDCEDPYNIVDYGDSDTDSDGIEEWTCPNCDSDDVDTDWNGTENEAKGLRIAYEESIKNIQKAREKIRAEENKWDS